MYKIYGKDNCPYCVKAKDLLESKGLEYFYKDVGHDDKAKDYLVNQVQMRTVPVIFYEGNLIGGYDQLYEHLQNDWDF